jgi:formylglycine-generating enzyme required for sulfatase activity
MRGNVWEWTADWFDRDYYARSPLEDPRGPGDGYIKVIRGGDWRFTGENCRIDYPMMPPWKTNPCVGFRVVCEFTDPTRSVATAADQ